MGQIVKKKKKGRPSKADLARRAGESQAKTQPDLRRSLRRRNVRYNVDYDDYLDECDEDEEEDERRREKKKLKLVVKLNQGKDEDESAPSPTRADARGDHAISGSDDDEGERKPLKKRRINGGRYNNEEGGKEEQEEGEENEGDDCNEDEYENKHAQQDSVDAAAAAAVKSRKVDSKGLHSASGTPANTSSETPLPNRGLIEYIIAKCQRLDTYSVFAEPVDPEELPDYHDVIKHPMDFATVKSKLLRGQYTTLEQVESDVYLICSNAMTYNSRDTIYHEQAINIRETSHKMFEKLRRQYKRSQGELKSKSNSLVKKQVKKPLGCASQEPVGSDFSSGATLINAGLVQPNSTVMQVGGYELPGNNDSLAEGNNSLIDANQDVAEDLLSGRNLLSKFGRKPSVLEENRRATYNLSNQPVARSESIFSTFESEIKQLVTVGLHAEYAYARSLARFAANLGPVAWKIASHRIQQALPTGCRFGRGWVGEYEPLPTPVLILDHRAQSESNLVAKLRSTDDVIKGHKKCKVLQSALEHPVKGPILEGKQTSTPAGGPASEGKPSLFGSVGLRPSAPVNVSVFHQQQNVQSRNFGKPENNKGLKQVELNSFPSSNQNDACLGANFSGNAATETSKPREMVPKSMNVLPTAPYKKLDTNGVVRGELPDGKVINAGLDRRVTGPSADGTLNQMGRAVSHVPHGQEQGLSDPVQLMRMLAEKAQKQQASNHSSVDSPPVTQSVPSGRRDDSSNAAAAAARAWMSVGAGGFKQGVDSSGSPKNQISADSLYNPAVEFHQHISRIRGEVPSGGMPFQSEKNNFSFQVLASQPIHTGTASQFPNRPMIFPQLAAADPSRFQMQSPWRGINPHGQPRQKQETLPPDLNIGFQSPGSPARQSSGVLVDSQQPDLALQL